MTYYGPDSDKVRMARAILLNAHDGTPPDTAVVDAAARTMAEAARYAESKQAERDHAANLATRRQALLAADVPIKDAGDRITEDMRDGRGKVRCMAHVTGRERWNWTGHRCTNDATVLRMVAGEPKFICGTHRRDTMFGWPTY